MRCTDCNRSVQPVVALDIDGTLANYHGHFLQFAAHYLNQNIEWSEYDGSVRLAEFLGIDDHVYRQVKLAFRQGGLKRTMPAHIGAGGLAHDLRSLGAEVWITTTRPYLRLDNVDPDTREWLTRNHVPYDGLIYDEQKYLTLLEIVGAGRVVGVLEDLPDLYDEAEELGMFPVQFATRYNRAVRRPRSVSSLRGAAQLLAKRVNEWEELHGTNHRHAGV